MSAPPTCDASEGVTSPPGNREPREHPATSVVRGTAVNLGARLAAVALVLAITTFSARLGTEVQGAFALFTSVEALLLALFSGFGIALARRVSHHGEAPRALLGAVVCACLLLGALAALLLGMLSILGPVSYRSLWLLALAAPVLLLAPNLAGWWLGEGRMVPMALVSLAPPVLTLAGLLLLAAGGDPGLHAVLAGWVFAKVLVGLAALWVMAREGRLGRPRWAPLAVVLPFVAVIGGTNLIGLLNYRVGLFVIEQHLGLSATGVYSIAVVVAELLWFVSGSLTQAVYGRIGTPDAARAAATTLRVVQLSALVLVALAPVLVVVAVVAIPRVLGPAYAQSVALLAYLLPGVLVFGSASALSAYFTNHAGQPRIPAQVALVSLAINLGLSLWWVPAWGMPGAALAATVAYTVSVAVLAWRFTRHAGLPLAALWHGGPQLRSDLRGLAMAAAGWGRRAVATLRSRV